MAVPAYLSQSRHGIWYFRWPLPKSLHPRRRASDIKVSLITRDRREALRLARSLGYLAERLTVQGTASGMRYDEIRAILTSHFAKQLAKRKAEIAERGRLPQEAIAGFKADTIAAMQALEKGMPIRPGGKSDDEYLATFCLRNGIQIDQTAPAYKVLRDEFMRAYRDYCRAILQHDASFENFDLEHALPASRASTATKPDQPSSSLAEIVKGYAAERVRGGNWTGKTEDARRAELALLIDLLGASTPAEGVRAPQARQIKENLCRLPKNRNKNPRTKGLAIAEAMALPDEFERMDVTTINKHLTTYSALFGWAKQNGLAPDNPFDGLTIRESKKKAERRAAFTQEQVRLMLTELHGNERGLAAMDYRKWGGLLGIYTGARLNEIAQIALDDIKQDPAGAWYFDFNDEDGKQLKSEAAKRQVPVHTKLIEAGLLDYVARLKEKGETRLLYELTFHPANGYGRNLGRWFNDTFLVGLGLKTDQLVFHCLRHTVADMLAKADVPDPIIKDLIGHSHDGVTRQVYVKGSSLEQLSAAIHKLPW